MLPVRLIALLVALAWVMLLGAPGVALACDGEGPSAVSAAGHSGAAGGEDLDLFCDLDSDTDGDADGDPDEDALPAAAPVAEPAHPAHRLAAPPLRGRDSHPPLAPVFRPPRVA